MANTEDDDYLSSNDEPSSFTSTNGSLDGCTNDDINNGSSDVSMNGVGMIEGADSFNSRYCELKSKLLPPECRDFMSFSVDKDGLETAVDILSD